MSVLALDVGGTKLAGGILDTDGVHERLVVPTPGPVGGKDPGSHALQALVEQLLARAATAPSAIGVAFCEFVDHGLLTSREVMAWEEQPADWIARLSPGTSVVVESDVRCGAVAEARLGVLRGRPSGLYVSWGTGLSCALVLDGVIWPGHHGRAIALGELPAPGGATTEAYASGAGMVRRYAARTGEVLPGARELLERAASGDAAARDVAVSAGRVVADACAVATHLVDPAVIVLGGGLGTASNVARESVAARWAEVRPMDGRTQVVSAHLGSHASLLGAGLVAGWEGTGL